MITDPGDPRLNVRLNRFAAQVTRIISHGGGKPRGSELLDGVFAGDELTFERSRRFDVDRVSTQELHDIAETVRRRFLQQSVLTFDRLDRDDPAVDAIELDVPHVTAKALQDGLVADPEAAGRLFGGSVTLDDHLLLVADLADAGLARRFAERIGGDLRHARTSYGDREFVEVATEGRARIDHRTLVISGTPEDDTIALREGRRLAIDFGNDGVVDFEPSSRRFDRIRIDTGEGNDTIVVPGTDDADEIELTSDRLQLVDVEVIDVDARGGADRLTVDDLTTEVTVTVNVDLGAGDGALDRVVANGSSGRDNMSVLGFSNTVFVLGPTDLEIDGSERTDRLRVNGRDGQDAIDASTDLMRLTLDGGDGGGTLFGGPGDDTLIGGDGFDDVDGNKGADTASMGRYFDRFSWSPGDGSDRVDGGPSHDSLFFTGTNDAETFDVAADGHRVRFLRNPGAILMDLEDVEELDTIAFGGADVFTVGDLSGTGVDLVDTSLAPSFGTPDGDKAADRVEISGTDARDALTVVGKTLFSGTVTTTGLPAKVNLTHTEPLDTLAIHTGAGDTVDSTGLEPNTINLAVG